MSTISMRLPESLDDGIREAARRRRCRLRFWRRSRLVSSMRSI